MYVTREGQMPTFYSHRRLHTRVLSIFGPISIPRMGYCRKGNGEHPSLG
jgi:hypothetical protein